MSKKVLKALYFSLLIMVMSTNVAHAQDYYWVGGTGAWHEYWSHWATTSGGTTFHTAPPAQNNNVFFDQNSFPGPNNIVTVGDPTIFCHDMTWVNVPNGTVFICGANINISGSLVYASNMLLANNSGVTTFISGGTEIINSGGAINPLKNVTFNGNGTWTLQNYLNVDNDITLDKGKLITANHDLMCSKFISTPAILTNLRIMDLGNSHWYIKSANNPPYLSWNVDNSMGTFQVINPGNSIIHFLNTNGLSTMHAGTKVIYHDVVFDGNGRLEIDLDTIHNATFHGNGEIIGDSNIVNDVQCDKYGMINGHNNIFHDINIDGNGDIGNLSLSGRDVNHNRFHNVSIGKTGYVYGDYNVFTNMLFSTKADWPCEPDICCYAGAEDPGYLYGNHDTVYENLVFHREGHVFGGLNFFYNATFWCDGWVLQGSNDFFNLNLYRDFQECFASFQGVIPVSVHSNVLTLQSDSTQYLYDNFNLLGNIYCKHTEIKSSDPSLAAHLNSDSVLVVDYVRYTDIHSANTFNIPDTATRSEDNGGNFFWDFAIPYVDLAEGNSVVTPTSPCFGDCNGKVVFNPDGGVAPYLYTTQVWMPGFQGVWLPLQSSNFFSGLCPVEYPFIIVDTYGCILPLGLPIPFPPQIDTTSVVVDPIQCNGELNGAITVNAFGGTGLLSYSLDSGASYQASHVFANLAQGTYYVRVKDAVGCFRDFGPFVIIEPPLLQLNTGGQSFSVQCHGDSTAIIVALPSGGTPPYTYVYSGPLFSSDYNTYTIMTDEDTIYGHGGLWNLTVTDAHGCTATAQTQRTDPAPIIVNVTVTSFNNCADTNHFVLHGSASGGTSPYLGYYWYNSSGAMIGLGTQYQFVSLGTYMLVVEDHNHCRDTAYKTIDILHDSVTFLKDKSCKGSGINDGAICVTGLMGSGAYTYNWSSGMSSQCIGGLDTGMYIVTVTDAQYGCYVLDSILIRQPDSMLTISLYADSTSCNGLSDGLAWVVASGGTPPYSYQWTGNTGPSDNDSIKNQAAGIYFVKVSDSLGCYVIGSISVYSPPSGQVQFDSGWNCQPTSYWAQAIVSGGTLPYSYNWNPSYGSTTDIVTGPPGLYQVTVTDHNGCPYLGSVDLLAFEAILTPHNALCYHDSTGWAEMSAAHGNPPYAYQWFRAGPPELILPGSAKIQTGLNAGDYFVVVSDFNNCTDTTWFTITEPAEPVLITIQANSDNNLCHADCKGFAVATTQGGVFPYTYNWTGPAGYTNTSGIITGLCPGTYHVTVTDVNGCVMVGVDSISSPPDIIIDSILVDSLYCNMPGYTGSAGIYAHGGTGILQYRLDGGAVVGTSYFTNLAQGPHVVDVIDAANCVKSVGFNVPAPAQLSVNIDIMALPLSFSGAEGELGTTVSGGIPPYTYLWSNGAVTPVITGLVSGNYCVTITDSHACTVEECIYLPAPGELILTLSYVHVRCHGMNNGKITASASGGVPPYTFVISPLSAGTGSNPLTWDNLLPGTYTISLIDHNGITKTEIVVITEPSPYNVLVSYPDSVCPGTTEGWAQVSISGNTPYSNPPFYNINWSGGTIVAPDHVTNLAPGPYSLSISDSNACPFSSSFTIQSYDKPVAAFDQPAPICLGNTVMLQNTSSVSHSTLEKVLVDWGDGNDQSYTYPTPVIQHQYGNPGTYTITMYVIDANQCQSAVVSHDVQVLPIPEAKFANDTACYGNPTTLTDISLNSIAPGKWIIDGTEQSYQPVINPVLDHWGYVPVKLIVQNALACKDSITVLVPVDSLPVPSFGFYDSICVDGMVRFWNLSVADGSPITQYQWNFGDGYGAVLPDPIHVFLQTGTSYPVTLTVTSQRGCSDSLLTIVPVSLPFVPGIIADTVCLGEPTQFEGITLTPTGDDMVMQYWHFGDGATSLQYNPAHQYANPGSYNVVLVGVDEHGCENLTYNTSVYVNPLPEADFTYQVICGTYTVNFLSNSQFLTTAGNSLQWTWQSGGVPQMTTNSAIQHTFPGPGEYMVRLVVFNGNSCTDTIIRKIELQAPLLVDFTFNQACEGGEVQFQNLSMGTSTHWLWNFESGSGDTSHAENPAHVYSVAQAYAVTLTVYDVNNCPFLKTKSISIHPRPVAAFSAFPANHCQHDTVFFVSTSSPSYGNLNAWLWNFGDPPAGFLNVSGMQNPAHYYIQSNTYPVTLIVSSDAGTGCLDTITQPIFVRPRPQAVFNSTTVCLGDSTAFANSSVPVNAALLSYAWDFGEPASGAANHSSLANPKHCYAAPGTYVVSLIVTDEFSCADTSKLNVTVFALPVPAFTFDTTYCLDLTHFTSTSQAGSGNIVNQFWDFGDGSPVVSGANPTHSFSPNGGAYWVKLTVINSNNCSATDSLPVIHMPCVNAGFSASDTLPCASYPITFTDTTSYGGTAVFVDRIWDFDGAAPPSHASPVSVLFNNPGTYTISLYVIYQANSIQFTDSVTYQLSIHPTPQALFYADSACFGDDIHLDNQTTLSNGNYASLWYFGFPGAYSNMQDPPPVHYNAPGTYLVSLAVESDHNCRDTAWRQVHVWPEPVAAFSATPAENCGIPALVEFTDLSTGNIQIEIWDFDYGMPVSGPQGDREMVYNTYGQFSPSLVVISDKGCSDTLTKPNLISILQIPVPAFTFTPDPVSILDPVVHFYDNSSSPGNYLCKWNFGDNNTWLQGNCNPEHTYADTGIYQVTLVVQDENGCDSSITQNLVVEGSMTIYVPNSFSPDGDNLNDEFGPIGAYISEDDYQMMIFSRWGEEIFHSQSPDLKWDGEVRGTGDKAPVDVYTYYILAKDLQGSVREFKGFVLLLRKE